MHLYTVLTFSLSLLIVNSFEYDYSHGKYGQMRRAAEDDLAGSLTPIKYRRGGLDAYGDLSTMMRSIDELQRPRFGRK
ncbi:hypothetical protein ANCCAN_00689 [Ancylostoma caninum]|uniref:Uncharacterized protein n=1 Tax=Ancylostoma caninum TaxID=29170 RepID=A0A368H9B0_ANCCA|nr:hypothetical protein ANCCAN_00689 [Ancylostoma caninum]